MKSACPYDDCEKILSSKFNLQRHIDTCHLRIKRFECEVCFKRFASKQNLREHEFIHEEGDFDPSCAPQLPTTKAAIEVPQLTSLLKFSSDPQLRPYLHVTRVYPYPVLFQETQIPLILQFETPLSPLPPFPSSPKQ